MGLFQEYLNSKKTIKKPQISVNGDVVDPMTPPKSPKDGKPYGVESKKFTPKKEKGFADEGDQKLKYCPKTNVTKIPIAEKAELCSIVIDSIKKDFTVIEQLVYQLRHNDLTGPVLAELLQFKETYSQLAEAMNHKVYGKTIYAKLSKVMHEEVAPPFAASLEGEEKEEEEDDLENSSVGDEEGINDGDMDPSNQDPNSVDPLMSDQDPNQDPNMQIPDPNNQNQQDPNMLRQDPNQEDPNMQMLDPNQRSMMKRFQSLMRKR